MMNAHVNRNIINRAFFIQLAAAVAMFAAGIIHLNIISYHWNHAPAHGIFMLVSGMVELAWVAVFLRRPNLQTSTAGAIIAISMVLLWTVTRVFPAPYGDGGPEDIDVSGLVSKLVELMAAGALFTLLYQFYLVDMRRSRAWQILVAILVAGLALGGIGYGAARASEPLFPDLVQSEYLPHYHTRAPWDTWRFAELVSHEELAQRSGIEILQLTASGLEGGLIDMRLRVLDADKGQELMDEHELMPRLVVESENIELEPTHGHTHIVREGQVYYMFFPNPDKLIKSGDAITIAIDDSRAENFVVK